MRNFEAAVDQLVERIEPDNYEFNDTARSLATIALHDVELRYGENSESPLPRHNADHGLDVAERAIDLVNLLFEYIPDEYKDNIYELALLVSVSHDWEQLLGNGENEAASAEYLIKLIEKTSDEKINNDRFKERSSGGVFATEFAIDTKGVINQVNLLEGEADPLKFVVAFADINGMAMEGEELMPEELAKLFFEQSVQKGEEPSQESLQRLVDYQESFIRSQLNDYRMKAYIARYFPHLEPAENSGEDNPVYTKMHEAYNPNIKNIYEIAKWLRGNPTAIKGLGSLFQRADVLGLADKLGKAIKNK